MRLGLLTLLWKRPRLSRIVLSYYNGLDLGGIELVKHAVGSEGDKSRVVAEDSGWRYSEHPNQPFTDKWNAAMSPFKEWDVEGVMIIGSDNLHNPEYFYMVKTLLEGGMDSIRIYSHYNLDVFTRRMYCFRNRTIGTGRTLSSRLLEAVDWNPWRPGKRRNADGHLNNNIWPWERRIAPIWRPERVGATSLSIKTGEDMHQFDRIQESLNTIDVDYKEYFDQYFPVMRPILESYKVEINST